MSVTRSALLGGWQLESFDVGARRPFGEHPRGLILYTADGWMSAQLAPGPGAEPGQPGIAYCGRYRLDEATAVLHHQVTLSTLPELLERPQLRNARIDGDVLTLSTDDAVLTWRRSR